MNNSSDDLIPNNVPSAENPADESNWVDDPIEEQVPHSNEVETSAQSAASSSKTNFYPQKPLRVSNTLVTVETAFLASTASLIWLINYYFPLGPVLKIFFPIPTALVYLRWGQRASWMAAIVSGLLLSVLMGPTRSIVFLIPYGVMGVQLGACWKRGASWNLSLLLGTIIGVFGLFFRVWLFSILLGEDLWLYAITQVTQLADWLFMKLGLLAQPDIWLIQLLAVIAIILNNLLYLFAVHLVALLVLDRLGNPITRPPSWVQVILDYE